MGLGSMTAKDASLTMKLSADSGYSAVSEYRVSAYEWGDIVAICEGSERGRALMAGPDLLEALRGAIGALEFSRDYHGDLGNEEQAFAQDKLDAANKAIAKAEAR